MFDENKLNLLLLRSKFVNQKNYWNKKLSGKINTTILLKDHDKKSQVLEPGEISMSIPSALGKQVIKLSKGSDLSIYIFLLSILKILIYRYMLNEDSIVISPINKSKATVETINDLLFIRDRVNEAMTFRDLVLEVRQSVLEAYENQDYPFQKILESLFPDMPPLETHEQALSRVLCSLRELHGNDYRNFENIKIILSFCFFKEGAAPSTDEGGYLAGDILYDANIFKENEIRQLSHHFTNILAAVTGDVNIKIPGILFLTEEEKKQLLVDFNNKIGDFSRDRTIYHFIEDFARETPDSVALVFHDEKITYRYLNTGANVLAGQLRDHGVGGDVPVVILLDRSPQMMKSIIATWKAGGAYIPLSTEYPAHRVHEILKDSQAGVLVTESGYVLSKNLGKFSGVMIIKLGKPGKTQVDEIGNSNLEVNMDNLSYVIYTSGTTGKPKGVMIEHRGMMNHIQTKINDLELENTSIVVQNAPSTFDISVWQFFAALVPGGQTVIYPDELIMQPERLLAQLVKDRVTIFEVVPSYLSALQYAKQSRLVPLPLKYLLVTGEEIKFSLVKKWFEYYPHIKIINAYGPTEASDDITHYMMDKPPDTDQVPIGAPLQNFKIYIVDRYMNLCPVGVKGELCVSGVGVGRGYLNRPELTAEKFYRSYRSYKSYIPKKIYKTGDLACWLPNGNIEYFGRIDQQVKIRGYRIELGEIESQLLRHESIKEVVVMAKEVGGVDTRGGEPDKHLCAYIVADSQPSITGLREYLSGKLPEYMVPYHFFILDKMPLSPNGKVDRKALPGPETEIAGEYIAPQDELEKKLVRIWAELLHVEEEKIGIVHDFFQLGGHSLSLIQLVSKIYREFNVEVSVTQIFNNPIIKNISKIIKENILAVETPVVLLNRQETEKKIFCFPPQVGYGIMYQTIASIAEDYSWYSFNFIEDIDPEERIKIYMDCITNIQPQGPYIFFGYSAAGTLTFQAAKALENHGHQVSDIIFFDCGFSKTKSPELSEEYKRLIEQSTDNLLNGIGAAFLRERVLEKTYKYMEYYGNIDNLEKINANVHLVISEEFQNHIKKDRELDPGCWEEFTTKDCFYYIGSGQHQKMFVDGPREKNSKLLREILNNIESGRYPLEKKSIPTSWKEFEK